MDSPDAAVDHDRVVLPGPGYVAWRPLGLRGVGLGRLLGMGSGRERVAATVADGHRVSAFGNDAGKARHDEGVERLAGLHHIYAVHPRNFADAQRCGQLRSCLRAVEYRKLLCRLLAADFRRLLSGLCKKPRLPQERKSTGLDGFSRVELSL